jgi:glutamate---cysteine ligase / carboxylate-amine ligase
VPPVVPDQFPVTDTPRYRRIGEQFGMVAHEQGICGAHVHVEVPDREAAVAVSNHLRPWLPTLLAITANSAVYRGAETGYVSWRSILWQRWPCAGPPPYFHSASHYDEVVEMMVRSGTILDDGMVYWDVRPSAHFPTVEIRVSDVPATVDESVLFATLVRALVMTALGDIEHGVPTPEFSAETLRAAYWKAAHDGIRGEAIDVVAGDVRPAAAQIAELLATVRHALEEVGDYEDASQGIANLLANGNGAVRQLAAFRRRGEADDVIAECTRYTLQ